MYMYFTLRRTDFVIWATFNLSVNLDKPKPGEIII